MIVSKAGMPYMQLNFVTWYTQGPEQIYALRLLRLLSVTATQLDLLTKNY